MKDVQQRLKKEQARARKITEERDELQRKCKAAENALEAAKLAAKDKDDKTDKRKGAGARRRMAKGNSGARGRRSALVGARKNKKRPRRRASAKRRRRPAQQNVQSNSSTRTKS